MPRRAKKPCGRPGCGAVVEAGVRYCAKHVGSGPQRKKTAERGYGNRWRRARRAYLAEHPLCVACEAKGRVEPATEVDHIIPHRGDVEAFWDVSNWQALCKPCHSKKTGKESGAASGSRGDPQREGG